MKNNKAPRLDGINNQTLKNLPESALNYIKVIFNDCMRLNYFPEDWKVAKILVFPKAGKDLTKPDNYRPISLLNTLSKLFEGVLLNRLKKEVHGRNLIRPEQFGFRPGHSIQHQVLRLTEKITERFNNNEKVGAVLLYVAKAFDSVLTEGLLLKLNKLKISTALIKILASYLKNRCFRVAVYDSLSESHPATAGVPQGSLLGPVLFIIYVNDMPTSHGVDIGIYADDTVITVNSRSVSKIVKLIDDTLRVIKEWCAKWRIKINPSKSESILFHRKQINMETIT